MSLLNCCLECEEVEVKEHEKMVSCAYLKHVETIFGIECGHSDPFHTICFSRRSSHLWQLSNGSVSCDK